jgi:hypothetical protein
MTDPGAAPDERQHVLKSTRTAATCGVRRVSGRRTGTSEEGLRRMPDQPVTTGAAGPPPPWAEHCTCSWTWKNLGRLYGISMGAGWVRMDTDPACPDHGAKDVSP